jgi:hypothetical protein
MNEGTDGAGTEADSGAGSGDSGQRSLRFPFFSFLFLSVLVSL